MRPPRFSLRTLLVTFVVVGFCLAGNANIQLEFKRQTALYLKFLEKSQQEGSLISHEWFPDGESLVTFRGDKAAEATFELAETSLMVSWVRLIDPQPASVSRTFRRSFRRRHPPDPGATWYYREGREPVPPIVFPGPQRNPWVESLVVGFALG